MHLDSLICTFVIQSLDSKIPIVAKFDIHDASVA